jgi:oxygen-independent coproporphyrinogen-3 oxidase
MMDLFLPLEEVNLDWEDFLAGAEECGAYLNIPFCPTICDFCGFFKLPFSTALIKRYLLALVTDVRARGALLKKLGLRLKALYIGGGTPTILSEEELSLLLAVIDESLPMIEESEFTFEASLSTLTPRKIDILARGGVNRLSIGVQSFNPEVRGAVGRRSIEPFKEVKEAVLNFKGLTVIDLIHNLPGQSLEIFESDLKAATETGAKGLAVYLLKIPPQSNLAKKMGPQGSLKPLTLAQAAPYRRLANQILPALGWSRISAAHFAPPLGDRNVYNHLSASRRSIIPMGIGAGGYHRGRSWVITRDLDHYETSAKNDAPLTLFSPKATYFEFLDRISLDLSQGLLQTKDELETSSALFKILEPTIEPLVKAGLFNVEPNGYSLTEAGWFWSPNIEFLLRNAAAEGLQKTKN